jgi:hypothetical protein
VTVQVESDDCIDVRETRQPGQSGADCS